MQGIPTGDSGVEAHTADKNVVEAGRSRRDKSRRTQHPTTSERQTVSLATIDLKPGFVDRKLISDQPAAGAIARISNSTPIDLIGTQMQTIDFSGEMGIFGEGAADATDAENKKTSNNATNGVVTINPITFYISYRFPKKFLQLFGVDGAYNPTDATFRAGSPQTMLQSILAQPYQAGILDQYRTYVNRAISRALDFAPIFGVNPATKDASTVARTNGYVLERAGNIDYTPGTGAEATTAFKQAVRQVAAQGDASAQGVTTSSYLAAIGDGLTSIGTPTQYAADVPLIGNMVNIGGVTLAASTTVSDTGAATGSGQLTGKVLDAVIGDFANRFVWGATPLSGIEVFDSGNPDGATEGDLGAVNKVMLRTEVAIGWGFIGGTGKFYAITHATA